MVGSTVGSLVGDLLGPTGSIVGMSVGLTLGINVSEQTISASSSKSQPKLLCRGVTKPKFNWSQSLSMIASAAPEQPSDRVVVQNQMSPNIPLSQ